MRDTAGPDHLGLFPDHKPTIDPGGEGNGDWGSIINGRLERSKGFGHRSRHDQHIAQSTLYASMKTKGTSLSRELGSSCMGLLFDVHPLS
jgi:hypothetical protein